MIAIAPEARLPLFEQYRPSTFEEIVGQDKAVARLQAIRRRSGFSSRAYWISGPSGSGKTTLAKIIANDVADEVCITEYDAGLLNLQELHELRKTSRTIGMGERRGRAIIINEAHGLSKRAIRQLLVMLEPIPLHVAWIFTTTLEGQNLLFEDSEDTAPLLSRCICLQLTKQGVAEAFANRVLEIAKSEGLADEATTTKKVLSLAKEHRNNFRAMLNAVESGALL